MAHEKIYLFDLGVFRSLRPKGPLDRPDVDLFFWRTRAGAEVDFIVCEELGLQASEVKYHGKIHSTELRALPPFRQDYPDAETAVFYRASELMRIDGVRCLPVEEFLLRITPDQGVLDAL